MFLSDLALSTPPLYARPVAPGLARSGSRAQLLALFNDSDIGSVERLCAETGLSQPRLSRLCRREFGDTPKKLLRRARFGRMLKAMRERPYAQWRDFIDPQYFDQSHFIRDFKYFLGIPPSRYLALPMALQSACAAEFARWEGQSAKI